MSKTERGDFDWNQGIRRSPPLTLGYLNQGNSFGIKHLIISVLFLVSFWDIKRKESLLGLRRAFFSFSPLLLDSLTQCPLHMSGQMAWTLGGRFSCSRTRLCLTSSTWLSFSSSWSRSEVLISLISLMRAGVSSGGSAGEGSASKFTFMVFGRIHFHECCVESLSSLPHGPLPLSTLLYQTQQKSWLGRREVTVLSW